MHLPPPRPPQAPSLAVLALPLLALGLLLPAGLAGADWPGWRGPGRDGKSAETGLLGQWPEGGPPLAWKASGLGSGYSSLAVVGDRIYTLGDAGETQYVLALAREGGKVLWKTPVGPAWKDRYGGARSTPTVDGDRVYALTTEGELFCLDAASGAVRWSRSLPRDFGGKMMDIEGTHWKFAESPLVDGERVIVSPGSREAALVALDKKTGKEVWRAAIPALGEKGADGAAYSSAVISHGGGVRQVVQLLGRGVVGVEAASGRFLWGYNRIANNVANIPTPIVDGDHLFVSTGYGTGAALLKLLPAEGGGVRAEEVYFLSGDTLQNHHGGMILLDGTLYTGTGHNKGFPLAARLADGAIAWGPVRNEGKGSAALTYADGRLYFRYQDGRMVLADASSEGYRERGTFVIPEVNQFSWSHPVIAGGKLYLREQDNLFCYDVQAPAAKPAAAASSGAR